MTQEEREWWIGVLRRLSAARLSTGPDGHLCRKLATMPLHEQANLCASMVTLRRYMQQNGVGRLDSLIAEYPKWWAGTIRALLVPS